MKSTDKKRRGTFRSAKQLPNLNVINRLPDEVFLEIFNFNRQSIYLHHYNLFWREKYGWFNLAHVCGRWRAIIFASTSRMDINVVVGPVKPANIESILSSHLPILIEYPHMRVCGPESISDSVIGRMRAALGHRDRVREIHFGQCGVMFKNFIEATNHHFPALESLTLRFKHGQEPDIPATFLRGPDRPDLRLRRLELCGGSLTFQSGLLSSITDLTDLTLKVTTDFSLPQGSSLLAYLQGMQGLRRLHLITPYDPRDHYSEPQHSVPRGTTVPMPKLALTHFRYSGRTTFLNDLMSGLSAPSLQCFTVFTKNFLSYLPRVIDDVRQEFRSVSVTFNEDSFRFFSSTDLGEIDHYKPLPFRLLVDGTSPFSFDSLSSTLSTKLATVEELTLNFFGHWMSKWYLDFPMREFLRQFRGVRLLRVNPFAREVGFHLQQGDDRDAIMPVLENVELAILRLGCSDEEYQRRTAEALAAFEPCERAGRPVKVYHSEQTKMQSINARPWY